MCACMRNDYNISIQAIHAFYQGVTGATKWPFRNDNLSTIMSGRRFELLMQFLHLNDTERHPARDEPGYDRLYKVRPFLDDKIVQNFKASYVPSQDLSVDESIIGFKGRLSWIQYLPNKPTKWEMKSWVLADACNGYTWNWQLYTGREQRRFDRKLNWI